MTASTPTRRSVLKGAGVAVAAAALWPRLPAVANAATGVCRTWLPATSPVLTAPVSREDPTSQWMFPTLLPAGQYLPGALDAWYLWLWTHDSDVVHVYTAPAPTGPFTARGRAVGPSPAPPGHTPGLLSSGDVVWDPAGRRLVSSPHCVESDVREGNGAASQNSFLMESTDGLTWRWLDGDPRPRLVCGPTGSPDSTHTGYGRLLRDLDGRLTTVDGRYWWLYRAQRQDGRMTRAQVQYTPYLASSPALSTDFAAKQKAFDTLQSGSSVFDVGSFVHAGGRQAAIGAEGSATTFPSYPVLNTTAGGPTTFSPRPVPLALARPDETLLLSGGGNVVRDPATGAQHLVQVGLRLVPRQWEVWVFRGVV